MHNNISRRGPALRKLWLAVAVAFALGTTGETSVTPVLKWAWNSSTVAPGALNVMMTPSVVDLTGDGIPEIVFGSTAVTTGVSVLPGFLRAISGVDGTELFTITDPDYLINAASSVATGDIDGDGRPEIIAFDDTGQRLIVFEHDGTFKWRSPVLEPGNWGAAAIADLDQDGVPEIIVGRQVLSATGAILWTGAGGRGIGLSTGPLSLVADVDADGSPNVVAGNTVYNADGTILSSAIVPDGFNAVANFDADPQAEIVLVAQGQVYLFKHTMTPVWGPVAIPGGGHGGPPTIADFDGDGEPEIGVAGAFSYTVFETDGTVKWSVPVQDSSSNRTGSSVFDFDGDGAAEVVYSDETKLWVFRGADGVVLYETDLSSCTWLEYPVVADVDADGHAEIVAVANNNCNFGIQRGVYVFGDPSGGWVPTRRIWNQHTYHITNVNADGTIPVIQENNWDRPGLNNFRLNEFGRFDPVAWTIEKTADQSNLTLALGQSSLVNYSVALAASGAAEVDRCVQVTDSLAGDLGTVCATSDPFSTTIDYPWTIGPLNACGDYTVQNTATLVANDTGATGSSSWTVNVHVPCATGCTLTQGYWKTHSIHGPAPYDETWALVGEGTPFYTSGQSWHRVLWTPPRGGNVYYILAHAYIAARLNVLNGAGSTPEVDAALAQADAFFLAHTPAQAAKLAKPVRGTYVNLASLLNAYNEGQIGPGHCGE